MNAHRPRGNESTKQANQSSKRLDPQSTRLGPPTKRYGRRSSATGDPPMRRLYLIATSIFVLLFACRNAEQQRTEHRGGKVAFGAESAGEPAPPRQRNDLQGPPVETGPPNVPEFEPAFAGQ